MFLKKSPVFMLAGGLMFMPLAYSQDPPVQPDNTKMNKGDASKSAVTADQQKMNAADRDLTQKIRKSIMAEKSLSTYAHNVKIISQNGKVTLKGPVRSEEEKQVVASKAADVAGGAGNIDNQLSIKPASSK
jgi:osmotically-inducible protein OsmY